MARGQVVLDGAERNAGEELEESGDRKPGHLHPANHLIQQHHGVGFQTFTKLKPPSGSFLGPMTSRAF